MNSCTSLSLPDQLLLLHKAQVFKVQGRDRRGHKLLHVIAKFFPGRAVSSEAFKNYLEKTVFPELDDGRPFSVVYVHTGVDRSENFPGISTLRSVYDAIPVTVKTHLATVYFVHPGLQSRLFLATFGRLIFSGGLYGKVRYVSRLELLWDQVRRSEVELPEFVSDHDEDLDGRPIMDYGLESDHPRFCAVDSSVSVYSMRCIA